MKELDHTFNDRGCVSVSQSEDSSTTLATMMAVTVAFVVEGDKNVNSDIC